MKFWHHIFAESEEQGWPQPYIAIPQVAYIEDRGVIERVAMLHGFSRVICTGDSHNTHFCRYV